MTAKTTTKTTVVTKSDLIAILVKAGKGTARALRDRRLADLQAEVNLLDPNFEYDGPEGKQPEPEEDPFPGHDTVGPIDTDKPKGKGKRGRKAAAPKPEAPVVEGVEPNALYTVGEIAEIVGLTKFAVRRWFRLGYLTNEPNPQARAAKDFHALGSDLARFLSEREAKAAAKAEKESAA